jgi:hypothetical protein
MSKKLVGPWYLVYAKNYKCALFYWHKEQNKFPTLAILVQHIFGILGNQIETKHILLLLEF